METLGIFVFDMDGTLVDSMGQHADVFGRILYETHGVPVEFSRQIYLSTAGEPLDRQFEHALRLTVGNQLGDPNDLIDQFWIYIQESTPVLFPDVHAAIEKLWLANYTLIISSGCSPSVVSAKIEKAGINQYFRLLLGTDYRSPNMTKGEGHFKAIKQELSIDDLDFKNNSAMVGDGKHDMVLAKRAGIIGIGRVNDDNEESLEEAGADLLVHGLDELGFLLQSQSIDHASFVPILNLKEIIQ